MRRCLQALLVVLPLALPPPAAGDQADRRLDGLFERLAGSTDPATVHDIESKIWSIWAVSTDPRTNEMMAYGLAAMRARAYAIALQHFDAVVAYEPGFAEGWNKRATVLFILGNYQSSVDDIKRTLALERRHFGALSGLGMCYDALDDKAGALKAYRLAIGVHPHLPSVRARIEALERELGGRAI